MQSEGHFGGGREKEVAFSPERTIVSHAEKDGMEVALLGKSPEPRPFAAGHPLPIIALMCPLPVRPPAIRAGVSVSHRKKKAGTQGYYQIQSPGSPHLRHVLILTTNTRNYIAEVYFLLVFAFPSVRKQPILP